MIYLMLLKKITVVRKLRSKRIICFKFASQIISCFELYSKLLQLKISLLNKFFIILCILNVTKKKLLMLNNICVL